eukprot:g32314.t1
MIGDRKVLSSVTYRAQMLHETVHESVFDLTDVEVATSGAKDTVDQVGGCTGEPLSDMKALLWALDGDCSQLTHSTRTLAKHRRVPLADKPHEKTMCSQHQVH